METKAPGDFVHKGNIYTGFTSARYAMNGDTYMSRPEIDRLANALWEKADEIGKVEWLAQAAYRLRLVTDFPSDLDAVYALVKAHVTWADICVMKS